MKKRLIIIVVAGVVAIIAAAIAVNGPIHLGGGNVDILKGLPANNDKNTPRRTVEDVVFSETSGEWKWSSSGNLVIVESESKWNYTPPCSHGYKNGTIRLIFELAPSKRSYRFLKYKYRGQQRYGNDIEELSEAGPFYEKLRRLL